MPDNENHELFKAEAKAISEILPSQQKPSILYTGMHKANSASAHTFAISIAYKLIHAAYSDY